MSAPTLHLWPREYVFLFSHMRSFSTVLSHVLGSHTDICGYTETHLKYRKGSDLVRLRLRVASATGEWPRGRYLLDKLLHNFMLIPKDLRYSPRLRSLIFVRNPAATIQSILRMNAQHPNMSWYGSPASVAEYYCERLTWLTAIGVHMKTRAFVFPAEALVDDTAPLLKHITCFLDLSTPLQPRYRLHRLSGLPSHGDTSERLQAGTVSHRPLTQAADIPFVDPGLVDQCNRVYRTCMTTLADWCPSYGLQQFHENAEHNSLVA
ncbi:MAG TPA: hypothetical protein VGN07_21595 [Steroidobacteraceae bacterium]